MLRPINLLGICGISGLCILLLIATQHRPEILYTSVIQNETLSILNILSFQRNLIAKEMENFDYPCGRFEIDAEKLTDLTLETGGKPVRSVIITTWRSGSTFFGDILNAMPGNYYHYEPLLNFDIKRIRGSPDDKKALKTLKKLFNCDYYGINDYLKYGEEHTYLFEHNTRLWAVCQEYPHLCWKPKFLTSFCKLFPLQSMKVVRLSLALTDALLEDLDLNIRIVYLVRDPRGTMQSRKHRDWCPGAPDCDQSKLLCNDLVQDYYAAKSLYKKYPSRFRILRYEDLSLNPQMMAEDILQFYGLPFDPMIEIYLDTHTKVNIGGVTSTHRDSKLAPFHWIKDLKWEEIDDIQNNCITAMKLWGYNLANFTDYLGNRFNSLLTTPFA